MNIMKLFKALREAFRKLTPEDEIHLDLSNRSQINIDKLK